MDRIRHTVKKFLKSLENRSYDYVKALDIEISNYLKGEISLDLLLNAYHVIILEEHIKDARPYNITQEGIALAGITEDKNNE